MSRRAYELGAWFRRVAMYPLAGGTYSDVEACNTAGWVTGTLDMTSEAGTTTEIYFEVVTDTHGGTVYFDDIGFVSAPTREVDYY